MLTVEGPSSSIFPHWLNSIKSLYSRNLIQPGLSSVLLERYAICRCDRCRKALPKSTGDGVLIAIKYPLGVQSTFSSSGARYDSIALGVSIYCILCAFPAIVPFTYVKNCLTICLNFILLGTFISFSSFAGLLISLTDANILVFQLFPTTLWHSSLLLTCYE